MQNNLFNFFLYFGFVFKASLHTNARKECIKQQSNHNVTTFGKSPLGCMDAMHHACYLKDVNLKLKLIVHRQIT